MEIQVPFPVFSRSAVQDLQHLARRSHQEPVPERGHQGHQDGESPGGGAEVRQGHAAGPLRPPGEPHECVCVCDVSSLVRTV